jgi:Flp pilus assembly protein TadG
MSSISCLYARARGSAPLRARRCVERARARGSARGQALVEFAAVLLPLMLVVVAIIQFGFLFAAYVGASNAAREGARSGTIYLYDNTKTSAQNDALRCSSVLAAAAQSIDVGIPGQFSATCATSAGGGDLAISYPDATTCTNQPRTGCQLRVVLTYRQPLFVPLVGTFLQADAQNRVALSASVTMVIN